MAREIKFRCWDGKKMDYDCRDLTVWNGILVPVGDSIIMQFTGLHDKNGKEIYEGDRIKTLYDHPFKFETDEQWITGEVEYEPGQWIVDYPDHGVSIPIIQYSSERIEVIGNIYEEKKNGSRA